MIARSAATALRGSEWIRRMFSEGARLRAEFGPDAVADLSLGNPILDPPPQALERLAELCRDRTAGVHRYTQNAGLTSTRAAVAGRLSRETCIDYGPEHIVMSTGAGGGLNVTFAALLDPGDEVIAFAPYFVDYPEYVARHGGRLVPVKTDANFVPDPARLADAVGPRTRAVLINSPNNPTGVTYTQDQLEAVAEVLRDASARRGSPIALISDEPYRAIVYDGTRVPWPASLYPHTIHITSFSKDLSLAGERIGYVAVSPRCDEAASLFDALVLCTRVLGFVNAPVTMQRWVEGLLDLEVDYGRYCRNRRVLLEGLERGGYSFVRPTGAFYVLPCVPRSDEDDLAFASDCLRERLIIAPGTVFGAPGRFRLSYAVPEQELELGTEILARLSSRG